MQMMIIMMMVMVMAYNIGAAEFFCCFAHIQECTIAESLSVSIEPDRIGASHPFWRGREQTASYCLYIHIPGRFYVYRALVCRNVFVCRITVFIALVCERMQNKLSALLYQAVSPAEIDIVNNRD
jgi:hypothetical protein